MIYDWIIILFLKCFLIGQCGPVFVTYFDSEFILNMVFFADLAMWCAADD